MDETQTQPRIRNFSIIAHIDHGKSTLADRLLEQTQTVSRRQMVDQVLDSMDLEREKGITIKARAVRMAYEAKDGERYELNLIDTPGHVDFSYEVSRSLAACEGALLVVDAAQGIEAQTMANVYLALEHDLAIVAVINKIDLPNAEPERVAAEVGQFIGLLDDEVIFASAKEGRGITEILEAVVAKVPAPTGRREAPTRALIFDSHYDAYKGVIAYVKVVEGEVNAGERIRIMNTAKEAEILELGVFRPEMTPFASLSAGEVGYIATGLKVVSDCQVGDTITLARRPAADPTGEGSAGWMTGPITGTSGDGPCLVHGDASTVSPGAVAVMRPRSRPDREFLPVYRTSTPRQKATRSVISRAASFGSG